MDDPNNLPAPVVGAGNAPAPVSPEALCARLIDAEGTWESLDDFYTQTLGLLCWLPGVVLSGVSSPDTTECWHFSHAQGPRADAVRQALEDQFIALAPCGPDCMDCQITACVRRGTPVCRSIGERGELLGLPGWDQYLADRGVRSVALIPVAAQGYEAPVVLHLYSEDPDGFSSKATALLLYVVRTQAQRALRDAARNALVNSQTRQAILDDLYAQRVRMLYQPVIDLRSGALCKVEALARLQTAEGRLRTPAEFLPVLRAPDLFALFQQGLTQVLKDQRRWLSQGRGIKAAINFPTEGLADVQYHHALFSGIERAGADPADIELEVLETQDLAGSLAREQFFHRLMLCGISVVQDDLGAGHSSLTRLESFPFHSVKIDQGLVRHAARKSPQHALEVVYFLTQLAHSLGVKVTVEGIENVDLCESMTFLGADFGQGYFFSAPMPAEAVLPWSAAFRLPPPSVGARTALGKLAAFLQVDRFETQRQALRTLEEHLVAPALPESVPSASSEGVPNVDHLIVANRSFSDDTAGWPYVQTRDEVIALLSRSYSPEQHGRLTMQALRKRVAGQEGMSRA